MKEKGRQLPRGGASNFRILRTGMSSLSAANVKYHDQIYQKDNYFVNYKTQAIQK